MRLAILLRHLRAAGEYPMGQGRLAISAEFADVIARRWVPITATPVGANSLRTTPRQIPASPAAPATVDAVPAGVILRTEGLSASATWTLPAASTATPSGGSNRAALPVPSARPGIADYLTNVVTTPAGVILRIELLPVSAT